MVKGTINIIAIILSFLAVFSHTAAQQPSLYNVKKMPFNTDYFNEISPVMVKDGVVFCSDKRFSGIKDRT